VTASASDGPSSRSARIATAIEWTLAAVSGVIILGLAGYLLFEAVTKTGSHPVLILRIDGIEAMPEGAVVDISVLNTGHATAAEIEIEGTLGTGPDAITSTATLDYAPAESTSPVALVFNRPVSANELALRVLGYRDP
jgi:uncharacterized protein (TIGR02588 family)